MVLTTGSGQWDAAADQRVQDRTVEARTQATDKAAAVMGQLWDRIERRLSRLCDEEIEADALPRWVLAATRLHQTLAASSAVQAQRDAMKHFAEVTAEADARWGNKPFDDDDGKLH